MFLRACGTGCHSVTITLPFIFCSTLPDLSDESHALRSPHNDWQRAITLADASVTSPFLEMFGRSPRATGLESERNNRPTAAQWLHLLNSSHILRKIEQSQKLLNTARAKTSPRELVNNYYLTILSRYPTDEEIKIALGYSHYGTMAEREVTVDLAWALLNSDEFLYRH